MRWWAIVLLLAARPLLAAGPLRLDVSGGAVSVANVFRLSAADQIDLRQGGRLALPGVNRVDDLGFDLGLQLHYRPRRGGRQHQATAGFELHRFQFNPLKNYSSGSLRYRWYPAGRHYLEVVWRLIPSYYLRPYRDRDQDGVHYEHCDYRDYQLAVGGRLQARPYRSIEAEIVRVWWYYNPWFTEFDTQIWRFGLRSEQRLSGGLRLGGGYRLDVADNIGRRDSDRPIDLSHIEHRFEAQLGCHHLEWFGRPAMVEVSSRVRYRFYTTPVPQEEDIMHAGQRSLRSRVAVSAHWELTRSLRIQGGGYVETRRVQQGSAVARRLKNFNDNGLNIGLLYRFG